MTETPSSRHYPNAAPHLAAGGLEADTGRMSVRQETSESLIEGGRQPAPDRSAVGLVAVIVAATKGEPRALTIRVPEQASCRGDGLPAGPLVPEHATLEKGLRAWVERQTNQRLGYVEQLYTFGDRDRSGGEAAPAAHVPARRKNGSAKNQ